MRAYIKVACNVPAPFALRLAGKTPETMRRMTAAEPRDNLLTFIVAGHKATALTLAWSHYLCR